MTSSSPKGPGLRVYLDDSCLLCVYWQSEAPSELVVPAGHCLQAVLPLVLA